MEMKEIAGEVVKGLEGQTSEMIEKAIEKKFSKSEVAKMLMGGEVKSEMVDVEKAYNGEFMGSYVRQGKDITKAVGNLNETTNSAGGYTLPKNMAQSIVELAKQDSPIFNFATVETISTGNSLDVVVEGSTGFGAGWIAEEGDRINTQEGDFSLVTIPAHEVYANPSTTRALVMDSAYDMEGYITRKVGERLSLVTGTAFVKGDGSGKPLGILDATAGLPSIVAQVKTTASSTAITYAEIVALVYALKTKYANNGRFFMNRAVKGYLQALTDLNGQPLLRESAIVGEAPTILGYPVTEIEDMDSAITAGKFTILFGDMATAYRVVMRNDMGMIRDDITKKGFVQFYTYLRVGGKLVNPEALVVLKQKP
jgi:HK97 family phage major capsid protein